jgi:adenosyl cobinamide kinase/adenosyl cobinamide phosphate guanylyltransferase
VIVLVVGGTRSGKSEVAERIAARAGTDVTYVATGTPSDAGMRARIAEHRARRPAHGATIERPDDLAAALRTAPGTVLVDSLGTWVAATDDFAVDTSALCDALRSRDGVTVVVSEEVGMSVHPPTEAGRRFADALGTVNRAVADVADDVLLVVAGRALRLSDVDPLLDPLLAPDAT